ncbi:hypothetical protein MTBLM1_20477 [Rhodospirillaceae bacterium LM-1]|nr:hypothetical protein MTBLM1_20477 [Rhodospirillaceae bacterium LM-1]
MGPMRSRRPKAVLHQSFGLSGAHEPSAALSSPPLQAYLKRILAQPYFSFLGNDFIEFFGRAWIHAIFRGCRGNATNSLQFQCVFDR